MVPRKTYGIFEETKWNSKLFMFPGFWGFFLRERGDEDRDLFFGEVWLFSLISVLASDSIESDIPVEEFMDS